MLTHIDERRILTEWIANRPFRSAKVVIAKKDCVVGDHHHQRKDETFYLLQGEGTFTVGETVGFHDGPAIIEVPRGTYHHFKLTAGSILLGVATAAFDESDEVHGYPPPPDLTPPAIRHPAT